MKSIWNGWKWFDVKCKVCKVKIFCFLESIWGLRKMISAQISSSVSSSETNKASESFGSRKSQLILLSWVKRVDSLTKIFFFNELKPEFPICNSFPFSVIYSALSWVRWEVKGVSMSGFKTWEVQRDKSWWIWWVSTLCPSWKYNTHARIHQEHGSLTREWVLTA